MYEMIGGVILGGLISWLITDIYSKRELKKNPFEIIDSINKNVQELYRVSSDRENKIYKKIIVNVSDELTYLKKKMLNDLVPFAIDIQGLKEVYQTRDMDKFNDYLEEALPDIFKFADHLKDLVSEFENSTKRLDKNDTELNER